MHEIRSVGIGVDVGAKLLVWGWWGGLKQTRVLRRMCGDLSSTSAISVGPGASACRNYSS